jgi:uncharacterized membrane protein YedE/YeeE
MIDDETPFVPLTERPSWTITFRVISILLFLGFTAAVFLLNSPDHWRRGFLCLISTTFGFGLKFAPFGFTCTFRTFLQGDFVDAMHFFVFLGLSTLFVSIIQLFHSLKPLFELNPSFQVSHDHIGVALALGSFLFGMGMQLASGCASGTLVGLGEGFVKSWICIWFFIAGTVVGIIDPIYDWWTGLPKTTNVVTLPWYATVVILVFFAALFFVVEYRKARKLKEDGTAVDMTLSEMHVMMMFGLDQEKEEAKRPGYQLKKKGRWVMDVVMAMAIGAFFLCEGRTIGVIGAFTQIGSRVLALCGVGVANWHYWSGKSIPHLLRSDMVLSDAYIAIGGFLAAAALKKFGTYQENSVGDVIKAVIGGSLMGFGGRFATGCNIGAMMSGITSSSVHGFVWLACALVGSATVVFGQVLFKKIFPDREFYLQMD